MNDVHLLTELDFSSRCILHNVQKFMARRKDHTPDEFRALTIDTATTLIAEDGLPALSARSLGRAIGYVPGTLYNHFANLEAIVFAVNLRSLDRLHTALQAGVAGTAGPGAALRVLGDTYVQFVSDNPKLWAALFQLNTTPGQRTELRSRIERTIALVAQVISALAPALSEADKYRYVLLLWSGMQGICAVISDSPDHAIVTPPRAELVQLLVETVTARLSA